MASHIPNKGEVLQRLRWLVRITHPRCVPESYLRIAVEGELGTGDEIEVVDRPDHNLSIQDVFRIHSRDGSEIIAEFMLRHALD